MNTIGLVRQKNQPCHCGSGVEYESCHLKIDSETGVGRVQAAKNVFLQNWNKNAANIEQQGGYEWMARILEPYRTSRILDIGSGDGRGVAALWRTFRSDFLLSLDENRDCLLAAAKRLTDEGAAPIVIPRLDIEMSTDTKYFLSTITGKFPEGDGVFLVESDILADPELRKHLESLPPFDAVTVWLIGTHFARQNCLNLAHLQITSNIHYRLLVQNLVYEIADRILRPGGILQVVDRGADLCNEKDKEETLRAHKDQASVTSLKVKEVSTKAYSEIESGQRISMIPTLGKENPTRMALISVISQKPFA